MNTMNAPSPATSERCPAFLLAEGVTAGYNRVPVIHGISIQVGMGEIVLVMGPNGAGKSTFVKAVTGKLPLGSGSLLLDGEDISGLKEEVRAKKGIGYVPQVGDVFPTLTVTENLEMGGYRLRPKDAKARIEEIFEIFPTLRDLRRRQARNLSGGERKTLGIARALVAKPSLLILDEPTANLAPLIAANVLHQVVETLASTGCAVLLIEQRVNLGLEVATWGYILTDGHLRIGSSASELRALDNLSSLFLNAPSTLPGAVATAAGSQESGPLAATDANGGAR